MPGVPSGRGCDACRKQKKKCDQEKPACSRCKRLGIPCIGAGKQRFKFQQEPGSRKRSSNSPEKAVHAATSTIIPFRGSRSNTGTPDPMIGMSTNHTGIILNGFFNMIKPSSDLRFNLAWSYGPFLSLIPQRLGRNAALDTAIEALTHAHSAVCLFQEPPPNAFVKYSNALSALKECLDDASKATTSETLAAIMVMLMCQNMLGVANASFSGHGEGAAQILKMRGRYYDPNDSFESLLMLSLRGPVVFEACFNPRIQFTPAEWRVLVTNHLDGSTPEGKVMECMARIPGFVRRGITLSRLSNTTNPSLTNIYNNDLGLISEIQQTYEDVKSLISQLKTKLFEIHQTGRASIWAQKPPSYLDPVSQMYASYQRLYGLVLVLGIMINIMLSSLSNYTLSPTILPSLQAECEAFVQDILVIRKNIAQYKPIGSNSLQLFLSIAWVGTGDKALKREIEEIIAQYEAEGVVCRLSQDGENGRLQLERVMRLLIKDT